MCVSGERECVCVCVCVRSLCIDILYLSLYRIEPRAKYSRHYLITIADEANMTGDHSTALAYLRDAIDRSPSLSEGERSLLEASCRGLCSSRGDSWGVAGVGEAEEEKEGGRLGRAKVSEVVESCNEVQSLIDDFLLPSVADGDTELKAFYLKLKANCMHYQYKVTKNKDMFKKVDEAQKVAFRFSYKLSPTHPIWLGVALDRCTFLRQNNKLNNAYLTVKTTLTKAVQSLDSLAEDSYKSSTLIIQQLRDIMTECEEEKERELQKKMEKKASEEEKGASGETNVLSVSRRKASDRYV